MEGCVMNNGREEREGYDAAELDRLWRLSYKDLAMAPGEPNARLREARFIMEVRAARETRQLGIVMTVATVVMAAATIAMLMK
jgi:hypothetical protein